MHSSCVWSTMSAVPICSARVNTTALSENAVSEYEYCLQSELSVFALPHVPHTGARAHKIQGYPHDEVEPVRMQHDQQTSQPRHGKGAALVAAQRSRQLPPASQVPRSGAAQQQHDGQSQSASPAGSDCMPLCSTAQLQGAPESESKLKQARQVTVSLGRKHVEQGRTACCG